MIDARKEAGNLKSRTERRKEKKKRNEMNKGGNKDEKRKLKRGEKTQWQRKRINRQERK